MQELTFTDAVGQPYTYQYDEACGLCRLCHTHRDALLDGAFVYHENRHFLVIDNKTLSNEKEKKVVPIAIYKSHKAEIPLKTRIRLSTLLKVLFPKKKFKVVKNQHGNGHLSFNITGITFTDEKPVEV